MNIYLSPEMMKGRMIVLANLLALAIPLTWSVAGEAVPISLKEAQTRALQNNPVLNQAKLDEHAARWGMIRAISDALPHINFNSSVTRYDDESVYRQNIMRDVILEQYGAYIDPEDFPPFLYKDMYVSSISVDQPIYNGGTEITALRIAGTRKKMINLTRQSQEKEILYQATTAYYNLCRAYQALQVQREALEVTRGYLTRFRKRQVLGLIADVDVLRWEVQAAADEASVVDAENALKLVELMLAHTMGNTGLESYYPSDLAKFTGDEWRDITAQITSLEKLWETTLDRSTEMEIARRNVDLEEHNVWLASANFQPKLNFNYTYAWQADDDLDLDGFETWMASITFSMPLFASFGNLARWQEARINVKRAEEGVRDFKMVLHQQLTAAYNDRLAATSRLKAAERMLEQAKKVLRAQENRHELGLITTLELLDARTAELKAQLSVINSRFDTLTAEANLVRISGAVETD